MDIDSDNSLLFSKKDDDYHTEQMIKKIKNTKKKIRNNYNNIQPFDDIHDIHDTVDEHSNHFDNETEHHDVEIENHTVIENFIEGNDPGPYNDYNIDGNGNYLKHYIDASGNVVNFDPSKPIDYEGVDQPDSGTFFDFQKYLSNLIEYMYACVYLVNYIIAYTIAVIFENDSLEKNAEEASNILNKLNDKSTDAEKTIADTTTKMQKRMINDFHNNNPFWYVKNPPKTSDVLLIMNFLNWFEYITISIFAIYNWYYIMFYEEKNADGELERIPISEFFYGNNLKCSAANVISQFWLPAELWSIINYFFLPAFFFVEHLQFFVRDMVPTAIGSIFNKPLCFVVTFIILIFVIQNYAVVGKKNIIDIINGNTANNIVNFMYFCIILVIVMLFISGETNCNIFKLDEKLAQETAHRQNLFGSLTDIAAMASKNPYAMLITSILFAIATVLRCAFATLICVPLGGILCMIFILFYSFFAIFMNNPLNVFGKMQDIMNYIREKDNIKKEELRKNPEDFVNNILIVFIEIIEFFYNHCFHIAYLVLFIYTFMNFLNNFKSSALKITLCTIIGAAALVSVIYIFYGLIDLGNKYRQMMGLTSIVVETSTPVNESVPEKEPFNPFSFVSNAVSGITNTVSNTVSGIRDSITSNVENKVENMIPSPFKMAMKM